MPATDWYCRSGDSEHAHGSFSSATSGSVEMSGSMSASATYSGSNLSSQRISMSATFSGGGSMNENFGGGFVNSIVDAGGGDSSHSSSSSNLSISQSDENSSQTQTVASVSSSNESSSYSVDIVQFGDIVGSGSATVTSSRTWQVGVDYSLAFLWIRLNSPRMEEAYVPVRLYRPLGVLGVYFLRTAQTDDR